MIASQKFATVLQSQLMLLDILNWSLSTTKVIRPMSVAELLQLRTLADLNIFCVERTIKGSISVTLAHKTVSMVRNCRVGARSEKYLLLLYQPCYSIFMEKSRIDFRLKTHCVKIPVANLCNDVYRKDFIEKVNILQTSPVIRFTILNALLWMRGCVPYIFSSWFPFNVSSTFILSGW